MLSDLYFAQLTYETCAARYKQLEAEYHRMCREAHDNRTWEQEEAGTSIKDIAHAYVTIKALYDELLSAEYAVHYSRLHLLKEKHKKHARYKKEITELVALLSFMEAIV